jgi:photosystem II stability/assembly factor-like uncharacterized protein
VYTDLTLVRGAFLQSPWVLFAATTAICAQTWTSRDSGTVADLRGVSAASAKSVWASGSKATYLRSTDSGTTWKAAMVPGAADLDFRGVQAIDDKTAFLLSSGPGEKSRIYKTADAGANWRALQVNPDPKGFWDAIAMWDPTHGIVLGDPVNGRFVIYVTSDGVTWQPQKGPPANAQEGAFAASNSCLIVRGAHEAWFGTGGQGGARVFHSEDGGKTWSVARTPIRHDSANAGIFSLAFSDSLHGVVVGGDYMDAQSPRETLALTDDGGKTWKAVTAPFGYRSAAVYIPSVRKWVVTGPDGSNWSTDRVAWSAFNGGYNAMGVPVAVGRAGAIGLLDIP